MTTNGNSEPGRGGEGEGSGQCHLRAKREKEERKRVLVLLPQLGCLATYVGYVPGTSIYLGQG
jgi:hypothetical protein